MNKTLFALLAFDYLILTFKSRGQRKIPDISWKHDFLSLFPLEQLKTLEHYFSLLVIDRLHEYIQVSGEI